jgi:hypothetical protein
VVGGTEKGKFYAGQQIKCATFPIGDVFFAHGGFSSVSCVLGSFFGMDSQESVAGNVSCFDDTSRGFIDCLCRAHLAGCFIKGE